MSTLTDVRIPFDERLLDELLAEADIDALLVTSKHNVQYLTGGHRFFWFDYMDAVGVSRYLPVLLYFPGRPEQTLYVGNALEPHQLENDPIWVQHVIPDTWGIDDSIAHALRAIDEQLGGNARLGVEENFLPARAAQLLGADGGKQLVPADALLDRLRMLKSDEELELLEQASVRIVDSMRETFARIRPGLTKREVVSLLREAETRHDLIFEYALLNVGTGMNRGASDYVLQEGDIVCLDSGGNYRGYIGDLARMGVIGEPDAQLEALLAEVEAVQQAARQAIVPGAAGKDIFTAAETVLARQPNAEHTVFVAHGMGLVSHEPPHLTSTGPVPYPATDADRPLEPGMVLSIETTMLHPERGFVKLEDTVFVTERSMRPVGDDLRSWTICGAASEQS